MNTINRGLIVLLLSSLILTGCSIAPEKQPEALQTNSDTEQPDQLPVI